MTAHLLVALLTCGSGGLEDGTLLALHNSNKVVSRYTGSDVNHIAMIINVSGSPWVYEATPAEVRRVPLSTYYREIGELNARRHQPMQVWVHRPRRVYAPAQIACMKAFLNGQVGRRYSVKNYVRNRSSDGIHCAELAATTLTWSGRFEFEDPYQENPASLMVKVSEWYRPPVLASIRRPKPEGSWCSRSWQSWAGFFSWCNWAWHESWTWCW